METDILRVIGENTRMYRERAGLTQADLAERVGVGTAFISRVERGQKRMRLETLMAVADALNVSVDLLLYQNNTSAQIRTLASMLEGCSPEFVDGIIMLVRVCLEKFEQK